MEGQPQKRAWIEVPSLDDGDEGQERSSIPKAFLERFDTSSLATQAPAPPPPFATRGPPQPHPQLVSKSTVSSAVSPATRKVDILVSSRQADNPMIKGKLLTNVTYSMVEGQPVDFHINAEVAVVYLSVKFHMANKLYILARLDQMVGYKKRILLCFCDCEGADSEMVDLAAICVAKNATLLVGWSLIECARYVEALKKFENSTPELIKGETSSEFEDVFGNCLTSVRAVNSTDVLHIGTTFHTMERVALASVEEHLLCPGLGAKKARRIHGKGRG